MTNKWLLLLARVWAISTIETVLKQTIVHASEIRDFSTWLASISAVFVFVTSTWLNIDGHTYRKKINSSFNVIRTIGTDKFSIQIHTCSYRVMVRIRLVRWWRWLWLRIEEPLIALGHHVSSFTAPMLEARKALGVRPLPSGRARIMIHVVYTAASVASHLPARWQRLRSLPWRWSSIMVHIVSERLKIMTTYWNL